MISNDAFDVPAEPIFSLTEEKSRSDACSLAAQRQSEEHQCQVPFLGQTNQSNSSILVVLEVLLLLFLIKFRELASSS